MRTDRMTHAITKIKILAVAAILASLFAVALVLGACSGLGGDNGASFDQNAGGQAYVTLSLAQAAGGISKSALPDKDQAVFGHFALLGTSQGQPNVTWQGGDGTSDAREELSKAKVSVAKDRTYTFTLTATTLGGAVYKASVQETIPAQGVALTFDLHLYSLGADSATGDKGSASVTVNIPSGGTGGVVGAVKATLYPVDPATGAVGTEPVDGFDHIDVAIENGKAVFETGPVDAGAYCVVFDLYGEGDYSESLLASWSEYIGVANEQASASTLNPTGGADGDQVDLAYKITYYPNDDPTDPATVDAPASFSNMSPLTAAALKEATSRPNYRIKDWYKDENLTQGKEFTSTLGRREDLDLWAAWHNAYTITIPPFEHGSATATPDGGTTGGQALAGETVSLNINPEDQYWVPGDIVITILDADGNALAPQPAGFPKTIARAGATDQKSFALPATMPAGGSVSVDISMTRLYKVQFGTLQNGSLSAASQYNDKIGSAVAAAEGDEVTVTISPATNYELETISATAGVTLSGTGDTRTFTMPASDVTVNAKFKQSIPFIPKAQAKPGCIVIFHNVSGAGASASAIAANTSYISPADYTTWKSVLASSNWVVVGVKISNTHMISVEGEKPAGSTYYKLPSLNRPDALIWVANYTKYAFKDWFFPAYDKAYYQQTGKVNGIWVDLSNAAHSAGLPLNEAFAALFGERGASKVNTYVFCDMHSSNAPYQDVGATWQDYMYMNNNEWNPDLQPARQSATDVKIGCRAFHTLP